MEKVIYTLWRANDEDSAIFSRRLRGEVSDSLLRLGARGLQAGQIEYKGRRDAEATMIAQDGVLAFLLGKLCAA